jgi:hypothetical protein
MESGDELVRRLVAEKLKAHNLGSEAIRSKIAQEVAGDLRHANPRRVIITQKAWDDLEQRVLDLEEQLSNRQAGSSPGGK